MAHASSTRLRRLFTIAVAGSWLGGLVLIWALVRPAPRPLAATLAGGYFLCWGAALVLAPPPRWRAIARFTLTTVALTLTLGGLELVSAVGLVDFRTVLALGGPDPRENADNALDPELIHIHKPYLKRAGATRGDIALALHLAGTPLYPYDVACDKNGFRNARDLSTAEVVVLGDSFVEGGLVATGDLMTTTLARLLGCTVANLGQSAYGPQQELAVLKRFGTSLRPRLCVWTFYGGNDLVDAERYEQLRQDRAPRAVRSTPGERSFSRNILRVLAERLSPLLTRDPADRAPWGTLQDDDGRTTRLFFHQRGAPLSSQGCDALNKVVSVLDAARTACAANRIPLLVVFVPEKFRVYRDHCTFRPDNPCVDWVLDDLPGQLGARVSALGPGIGFLDLTPTLAAGAAQGRLLCFTDDTHCSAEGHQVAGRAVAAYVTRHYDIGVPPEEPREENDPIALKADGPLGRYP
jgi:hypothetical protein